MMQEYNYKIDGFDESIYSLLNIEKNPIKSTSSLNNVTIAAAIAIASLACTPTQAAMSSYCGSGLTTRTLPRLELIKSFRRNDEDFIEIDYHLTKGKDSDVLLATYPIVSIDKDVFEKRINEIVTTPLDWDGAGALPTTPEIASKVDIFLKSLPTPYLHFLDIEEGIYLNSHGTISVEWRPNDENVISIEFGQNTSNYYAIINGEIIKSNTANEIDSVQSQNLEVLLQKMSSLYYTPSTTSY